MTRVSHPGQALLARTTKAGMRQVGLIVLVLLANVRTSKAQEGNNPVDVHVVGAALTNIDGWLRTSTVLGRSRVTYHFDEGLKDFRVAGAAIVKNATGELNRWAAAIDHRTGCAVGGSAPGCPSHSTEPVVTVSDVLQDRTGRFSIQFTVSTPAKDATSAREIEVRLIRLRKQSDGTFVREGGVDLLIP